MVGVVQALPVIDTTGGQVMHTPEDVAQMLQLKVAGLAVKQIAHKMGCSRNAVRRYLRRGGWVAYKRPERMGALFGDSIVATAILDRLLRYSHVITIRGDSYRLREKRRSGLMPQQSTEKELAKLT